MLLYVFGVALHDHVVRFHFEPQGNSKWRYFWKKSRKKWQFFFQIQLLYRKRILWTEHSGTKWHKIVELSKYALVHNQNSTWRPQNSRQSQENAKKWCIIGIILQISANQYVFRVRMMVLKYLYPISLYWLISRWRTLRGQPKCLNFWILS